MKITQSVDFLIWKYLVPEIRPEAFKSKLISVIAILYISFFNWPRRFIWHYFTGKGADYNVDTKQIIVKNSKVYEMLISAINKSKQERKTGGDFYIGQIQLNNPNYKYSVGSFCINYSFNEESVSIRINSDYRFTQNNFRITKHLHNWLWSLMKKGYSHDFKIEGNLWKTNLFELSTVKVDRQFKKYDLLNMLYV